MLTCNYTSEDLIVYGNVFCFLEVSCNYSSNPEKINEYNKHFMNYDFRNHIKYSKIVGDLYIYDGCINATSDVISHYDINGNLPTVNEYIHHGDLMIIGDFFAKNIYARNSIYSGWDIPIKIIRMAKLKEIF